MALELPSRAPGPGRDFYAFHGPVYCQFGSHSNFELSVLVRDACDRQRVERFTKAFIASMKGICNPFPGISEEQLGMISRLGKVLDRFDQSSFAAERANAYKILQRQLADLPLTMDGLRSVHSALHPGSDAAAKAEVSVRRADRGWRKSREWFDEIVETISKPLGLYTGKSTFGNVCEDGAILCGELVRAVAAGTCIAKIADAALRANPYCHKSYEDNFCIGFCRELIAGFEQDSSSSVELAEARMKAGKAREWADSEFGWMLFDPQTPKKANADSAAAETGKGSAQKRRRDFEDTFSIVDKHKIRALTFEFLPG